MFLRGRHRFRIALIVIVCLLFQQVAMAAYACSAERVPAQVTTMVNDCAGMGAVHAQDNPVLCEKHCTPDRPVLTDHAAPAVPPLALPRPVFGIVLSQSGGRVALLATHVSVHASDPPPRLRFCSLLI
jgi:hypothetical protein